ncbi:MAG TPA: glycosyltransferase family 4 protein [Longimicrobiales bacterium]|nr:glycosyltransferase family 4 protein [Longimicrobiales bacterium]
MNAPQGAAPLRILVVNWQDRENPQAGGAETHLHEIFGRLVRRGHHVSLLASGWPGCEPRTTLDGIEVVRVGSRHGFSLAAPVAFRRVLRNHAFDVVVEDLNKVPLFTPFWTDAPVALLVHHLFGSTAFREASFPVAAMTWLLERPIPRCFSETPTMAVSESTRADLARRGMDASRIEVIPNGVDLDVLTPDRHTPRFDEPTLLYLGRLKKYKGVDLIVRAVAELRRRGVPARLLIAGQGDHRATLERLSRELALGEAVEFLGFVSEVRKIDLFRRSWVHVLTSPKEGWGIANLEAAACGTATVASDAPGLRDSVVDGRTGHLVPHGDVGQLTERLAEFLQDPGKRDRMGAHARLFAERFSWEASALATERFLARLVTHSNAG